MSDLNNQDFNQNQFTPVDAVSGVESAPKKKTGVKVAAISAGAVAVIAGGSAIAYNASDFVKNQVKLATNDPAEYYAWVIEENASVLAKGVEESYKKYLDNAEKGQSANVDLKFEPSEDAIDMLCDSVFGSDVDVESDPELSQAYDLLTGIKSISVGADSAVKDGKTQAGAYVTLNDEKLLTVDAAVDAASFDFFVRIPELTEKWLGMTLEQEMAEELDAELSGFMDSYTEMLSNPEDFISPSESADLINRYAAVLGSSIEDIEMEKKEKVDIADISVEYTVLTADIDGEAAYDVAKSFVQEASKDKTVKKLVTEKLEICSEDEYDELFDGALESLKTAKEGGEFEGEESVEISMYVDATGKIRGIAAELDEEFSFTYACGKDGDKVGGELTFDVDGENVSAVLNATEKSGKYDGEIECKYTPYEDDAVEVSVEFDGFEIVDEEKGYMNGDITVVVPEIDPITVELASDGKKQEIFYSLAIDGTDFGKFTLTMSIDDDAKVDMPSKDDAVMVDIESGDFDLESYVSQDEVSAWIADLMKKVCGDMLTDEEYKTVGDQAAESFFAGVNGEVIEDEYYEDDWSDEEWSDEEWSDEEWSDEDWSDDEWIDEEIVDDEGEDDIIGGEDDEDEDYEFDMSEYYAIEKGQMALYVYDDDYKATASGMTYDSLLEGAVYADVDGNGTYKVSVTANTDEYLESVEWIVDEGESTNPNGINSLALVSYDAEAFENAVVTIDSVVIDGNEVAELSGVECDTDMYDGEFAAYIYDSWDDDGALSTAIGEWTEIEITFTVAGL